MRFHALDARSAVRPLACLLACALAGPLLAGCQGVADQVYYDTMETFGKEKRHILVDRVEDGRAEQQEAREQFQSTLEAFRAVTGFDGGDLEPVYARFKDEFDDSEAQARKVRDQIASIERVAGDLFGEWEAEIAQITSAELRNSSKDKLEATRRSYEKLITAMREAAGRMDPVLDAFRDRVLFLKHNVNAQAIASLQDNLGVIELDVERLINQMNASIAEADAFLATMER